MALDNTVSQIGVGGAFAVIIVRMVLGFLREERGSKRLPQFCGAGTAEYWRVMGDTLRTTVAEPLVAAMDAHSADLLRVSENQQRIAELIAGMRGEIRGQGD